MNLVDVQLTPFSLHQNIFSGSLHVYTGGNPGYTYCICQKASFHRKLSGGLGHKT